MSEPFVESFKRCLMKTIDLVFFSFFFFGPLVLSFNLTACFIILQSLCIGIVKMKICNVSVALPYFSQLMSRGHKALCSYNHKRRDTTICTTLEYVTFITISSC